MSGGLEKRSLASAELSDVVVTDDDSGRWICGLCVLRLEGPEPGVYGPTVSIDVAASIPSSMSGRAGELALIRRAMEVLKHAAGYAPEDVQSRLAAR